MRWRKQATTFLISKYVIYHAKQFIETKKCMLKHTLINFSESLKIVLILTLIGKCLGTLTFFGEFVENKKWSVNYNTVGWWELGAWAKCKRVCLLRKQACRSNIFVFGPAFHQPCNIATQATALMYMNAPAKFAIAVFFVWMKSLPAMWIIYYTKGWCCCVTGHNGHSSFDSAMWLAV